MGWVRVMSWALVSPVNMVAKILKNPNTDARRMLCRANSRCRFLRINQALTPMTKQAERVYAEVTVWKNLFMAVGENNTAQKSVISFRAVSGLNSIPTGFCIQAFATRIHNAEMLEPRNTIQVEVR